MRHRSLADELSDLSTQAEDLELEYNKLHEANLELTKDLNALTMTAGQLQVELDDALEELEWYRTTYPEGVQAYQVIERMEAA